MSASPLSDFTPRAAFLQLPTFPPIIGVAELAVLLDKSPATVTADHSRAPHKLPPSYKAPGCKSPRWITEDVIAWLRQYRTAVSTTETHAAPAKPAGAPTKAERVAAGRAGLTVPAWRAQQAGVA